PSAILVSLNLLASRDLDVDREFALGGEKGLLGYKNNSLSNENIAYLKLEFRNTLIENYKKLFSVGQAFFLELGSSSDKFGELASDVLANVGVGLRFFFPDLSPPRIFRIDLGIPLRDSGEINSFEIRFTTSEEKQITKSLFEEPTLFEQFQDLGVLD
ncbi:MAG: hypothetical protein NZO16_03205, partial [Deltaproteobacteria bacterium]|nr:hypothetical protein [Deltaproteobacteria bacterium]